jgi:murein hydrolase activator
MKKIISLVVVQFLLLYVLGQPAKKAALEKQVAALKQEIAALNNQLQQQKQVLGNQRQQSAALKVLLQKRQVLMQSLNQELALLDTRLQETGREAATVQQQLAQLKEQYAQSLVSAYELRHADNWLQCLFATGNFNKAQQLKQQQQYVRAARLRLVGKIQQKTGELRLKTAQLHSEQREKNEVFQLRRQEALRLTQQQQQLGKQELALQQSHKQLTVHLHRKLTQQRKWQCLFSYTFIIYQLTGHRYFIGGHIYLV